MEPPLPHLPRGQDPAGPLSNTTRTPASRRRPSWFWRWRRLLFLLGFFFVTAAAGFAYLLLLAPLPPATVEGETTFITDSTGARLATIDNGENRVPVSLSQVPPVLIKAVLDTEDHAYFHHGALDPVGILRAAYDDLRGEPLQGGSTIAQQYVKQVYVGTERTFLRKVKEAAVAVRLERELSKNQILERYLNTIYFGRGAYGVEAASQVYFGKDVSRLDLNDSAYLAGLIRSPDTADADVAPAIANERRDVSLNEMVRYGDLSSAERYRLAAIPVASYVINRRQEAPQVVDTGIGTQYFIDYVRRVLVARFGQAAVDAGGLRVRTTLNLHTQAQAYDAVYGYLRPYEPAGALVSVDSNGDVVAMVGGRDYAQSQVNLATGTAGGGSGRQAGSTFKAFLLAATVHEGYSLQSAFPAPPQLILPKANNGQDYVVNNFESESFSYPINLIQATALSVNTVFAQLEAKIGVGKMVAMAHAMGVTSPLPLQPSLVLGSADVSVLEMAGAYSTLADDGVQISPHVIEQVTTADGHVLWNDQPPRNRVLTVSDATQVDYALRQVVLHGTGTGAAVPGHEIAGKTGTTNNYDDAWFIGYTPTLTTAVWMGYPQSESEEMLNDRGGPVTGGTLPATIFERFMSQALAGTNSGTFAPLYDFPGRLITGASAYYSPTTTTSTSSSTTSTTRPGGSTTTTTAGSSASSSTTSSAPSSTTSTTRPGGSTTTTAPGSTTSTTAPSRSTPTTAPGLRG
ncbi:MAG: transglycosylase domain-containing protein [Acidimicrobiales bacterium]